MPTADSSHVMACMEVWGGNRAIDNGVIMPGLDAWVFSRPYQAEGDGDAGGDIHYLTSCATGRITRLIVADVSGHGAPVAKAADALRRLMRKHSNSVDQSRLVERVNAEFGEIGSAGIENESAGMLFATAVVATYFAPTDELAISNAGHPHPMRYDSRRNEWSSITHADGKEEHGGPTNLPLGVLENARYPTVLVQLRPSDLVLFYTNSLIESRDTDGRLLGHEGLKRVLAQGDPTRPETFVKELLERISGLSRSPDRAADQGSVFNDDVTALLVRPNALKPRPSMGLAIMGGLRVMREFVRAVVPGSLPAALPEMNRRSIFGAMSARANEK